jgi:hypothetical protein
MELRLNKVPNKTIYLKDSDVEIWDKAQKTIGGESISSIITDCLRARLRVGGSNVDNAEAMKSFLAKVNAEGNLATELHPFWPQVILDANTLDVGYKLHQKGAQPDRIMSLIVEPLNFTKNGYLGTSAQTRIKEAILEFWDGRRTDPHAVVRIVDIDILSRMQNLVGKHGLVLLKPPAENSREFSFSFVAVHPAPNLPAKGDDNAFQSAIAASEFTVQFDEGIVIDGSNFKVISGRYISLIRGRY